MDPSSYGHHHHHHYQQQHHHNNHQRYVPLPPPPPLHPPPPPSHPPPYEQSPTNLYPSRHHLPPSQPPPQLPPPRPLPLQNQHQQQHQQPYHPVPAPPPPLHHPYNPHHPQYTFSPNLNSTPNPNPSNVSHQFNDLLQRRVPEFDSRPDYWPENRVSRPRPVSPRPVPNLDREVHYHQFDRRPASPGIDMYGHDLEGCSRFRDLELNQREREELGRVHTDRWVSNRSSRDFGIVSMGFESNSNNSAFDREVTENVRWVPRLHDELIDNRDNDIDERDEMRVFSRKNDYLLDSETEMFGDRGCSAEVSHEFSRTPRKQIQKRSAFLRIQKAKPNHRSREDDRSHYLGYYNEGKTGSFRGKDLVMHLDHGMEEKEREGSPVELDVSFKSNSLVAKAIVTPPNSALVSDSSATPRNSKIRKAMVFDKIGTSLQPNKANESSAKLDASSSVVNVRSGSEDSKQSKGKVKAFDTGNVHDGFTKTPLKGSNVTLKKGKFERSAKVTAKADDSSRVLEGTPTSDQKPELFEGKGTSSCIGNMRDGGGQTFSSRVNVSAGENKVGGTHNSALSDKTGASVGKTSSHKATKKKTVPKKVVKKVSNFPLSSAKPKATKRCDKPVKADASTHCQSSTSLPEKGLAPLKTKFDSAAEGPARDVDLHCFPKESALVFENEDVNGASKGIVLKEVGTDVDPGNSVAPRINRKRSGSIPTLGSSGSGETKVDEGCISADNSALGLHVIADSEGRTETRNETIKSGSCRVEDVNKQLYHNEIKINYGLLRSEDIKVHDDAVDLGSSSVAMLSSTGFYSGSSNTQGTNIDCDIDNVNFGSKQVCVTPFSSVVEGGTIGGLPEANCSVGSKKLPHLRFSEETQVNCGSIYAHCSDHDRSTIHNPGTGYVNSGESNCQLGDAFVEHLSSSPLSLGNSGREVIVNAVESLECKDEYAANIHKRKFGTKELDLSRSAFTNISIESTNVITSANCQETTIATSGLNSNPAAVMGNGIGWFDGGLHNSVDKVRLLHESSSNDAFAVVSGSADGRSPENKRRKISASSSVTASVSQGVVISNISKSVVQLPSSLTDDILQLKQKVKVLSTDGLHIGGIDSCSPFVESVAPSSPCLHPLKLGDEQLLTTTPVSAVNNHQIDAMDIEGDDRGTAHVDTLEEQKIISSEVTQCGIAPEHNSSSLDQRLPGTDVEDDNHLPIKNDLPSASTSLVFGVDAIEVSATRSNDEAMPAPVILSDVVSPNNHDNLVTGMSTCKVPFCQNLEEKAYGDEKFSDDKPMIDGACNSSASATYSQHTKNILKSYDAIQTNCSVAGKAGLLPSQGSKNPNFPNSISGETHGRKNQLSHGVPRSYPTRSLFVFSASKNITSATSVTKPRTWHRPNNSSASPLSGNKPSLSASSVQGQMPKKAGYFQGTSYVRKGNSLVRKPVSVPALPQGSHSLSSSVYRLNSGVVNELKKGAGPNGRADSVDLRTGGGNTSFERPTTPPLSGVSKVPNHTSNSSGECTSSPLAEPSISDFCETKTNHASSMDITNVHKSPEDGMKTSGTLNGNGSANNLEDWTEQNESSLAPSNAKRVTYLKPKSNQLVATSDCARASILNADKNQPFSAFSDGYYKKSKNQLIRTALESQSKQAVTVSDGNSEGQVVDKLISSRTFGKRRSNKVVVKAHKPSKFSLVWTLHGARLLNNDGNSLHHPKVLPQLFPWKRMTYWRSFKLSSVSSCNSSLSTIGRKMLLLRKRNTVYTRSINGYSIRKSKVLSVGGSSLKWSKSIEKHSRKANEEATLAVAEAERKRREQKSSVSGTGKRSYSSHKVVHGTKLHPGERIFRIGSVRYKMDSSRRSLQRISDDDSCSASHLSENSAKKSYVPRRLVIGNDEYVRIGNGNQLVRNPKKRTRVLASEKVRWSLHTARLRLVKKKKYCQFFTRFGKCNKDGGKCPYIHDSSKIAVCTKFLKGLCSNPNCKLTHKVIPERMPDCSYFLQGLCTNENCPYRHVHVNPNASTCKGFLRGYCADGNECRKKHSYVCPNFEATGSCPEGSKCKLHHPKKRSKGKKSKRSMEHKNARGRYFGIDILEPKIMVSERRQALDDNDTLFDGNFSDYIRLDVSDDETGEIHQVTNDQMTFGDDDSPDLQLDDLDELIKPIRIMNK